MLRGVPGDRHHPYPDPTVHSGINSLKDRDAILDKTDKNQFLQQNLGQIKYLSNIIEQDQRGVKRVTRPMLGFKAFAAAQSTPVGIELMPMLRKGQSADGVEKGLTPAEQFYALAS
jgi:putative transposase